MTAYLERGSYAAEAGAGAAQEHLGNGGGLFHFRDVRLILRRRFKMITVIVVGALALASVVVLSIPPQFTATAIVLVDPRQQRVVQNDAVLPGIGNDMGAVESQVELVQSTTLARKVIRDLHLEDDPEFVAISAVGRLVEQLRGLLGAPPADTMQRALSRFALSLQVRRRGLTYVLEVGFVAKDADKAARIANAIAEAYLAGQVSVKFNATSRAAGWLGERLTSLRQHVSDAERAVADYKAEHQLVDTGDRRSLIEQQIADLNAQLIQARVYASDVQARYDQMRRVSSRTVAAGGLPEALQSQVILSLRTQFAQAQKAVADLSQSLGPRHPSIRSAQAELTAAQDQIAAELGRIAAGLRNQLAAARGRERALDSSMASLKRTSAETDQANVRLRELEREAEASRTVLQQFLVRFRETSEQQNLQLPDARIVSPASAPLRPSFPNPVILMALAAVASIVAAFGSALLAERLARNFRSVREIERLLALPVVGLVPRVGQGGEAGRRRSRPPAHVRAWPAERAGLGRFAIVWPLSLFGDAMRSLAEQLRVSDADQPLIIVVTAACAGEGTSTIAENLAHVLARSGPSTLLLDAVTNQPWSLAARAEDLLLWLRGGGPASGLLERDAESGVYMLSAGRVVEPHGSAEAFGTPDATVETVFRHLRRKFDNVVIDGGPMLGFAGSGLLPFADMALLVVAWGQTERKTVVSALERISAGADKLHGVVLNKVEREAYDFDEKAPVRMVA